MDVSLITDLQQLKALAYDFLVQSETAQSNLKVINNRIAELTEATPTDDLANDPATIVAPDIAPTEEESNKESE